MSDNEPEESSKTEDPTPKKLEEARRKGQVPISREVNNWIMLLTSTIVFLAIGPSIMEKMSVFLRTYIEQAHMMPEVPGGFGVVMGDSFWAMMKMLALPFLLLTAAAFFAPFAQVGGIFAPDTIKPDISKISPMKGMERLFSKRSLLEFVKGILKLGLIAAVGTMLLIPFYGSIEHMVGLDPIAMMKETASLVSRMMMGILVALLVVAIVDLVYQRQEHYKKMRMTKQELKEEYKQSEGDPHVKAKLRQLRQEKARARMMQAVPTADVVITNPTHFSIALKYNPEEMAAPIVVAKGVDDLALRIREAAKEHDVTIVQNPPLARILFDTVDIDQAIPAEHYKAVAEVISYVFRLKGKLKSSH
jgi:flagellar biosynthetic protein FlhB